MTKNSWKRELNRLLEIFEIESTISLSKIKHYFEAMGRPYDNKFRRNFLDKSTERLNTNFYTVLFGGHNNTAIPTTSNSIAPKLEANTPKHFNQAKIKPNTSSGASKNVNNFDGEYIPTDANANIDQLIDVYMKREFNVKCDADNADDKSSEHFEQFRVSEPLENLWDNLLSDIESKQNEAKRFKCADCDYATNDKSSLYKHKRIHISQKAMGIVPGPNDSLYKCYDCDLSFSQWNSLKCHLTVSHRNNRPSFNCGHCLRLFEQEIKKDRHESQSRRYECHLCKVYATRYKNHLQDHMRTHSGARPFQCHLCHMSYGIKRNLSRHMDTIHKHEKKHY